MVTENNFDNMLAEIKAQPGVLRNTINNNQASLAKVCLELTPRISDGAINNVLIVARGSSDNAATLGKYLLETKVGLPVSLAAPSIVNLYQAPLKLSRTLVIGVSQSGKTNEVIEFLEKVKARSAYTIGITNEPDSDLAHLGLNSDLFCYAGTEKALAATKSFTGTMMVFYLLAAALAPDLKLTSELMIIPELVEATLATEPEFIKASGWVGQKDECIVISRGYNYPIALEASLKLQETAYIRAKAYSGADFQHGPVAITENGMPFIMLKADGSTYNGMNWLAESLVKKGAELLVISSKSGEVESSMGEMILKIPSSAEWLSPFSFTVASQLLAYYTAKVRGINPNKLRWLNKVTLTQ